jgi:hypothetical protein
MLYWIKVYAMVGVAVCLPIGALYLIASASRIGTARSLRNVLTVRAGRWKENWNLNHR